MIIAQIGQPRNDRLLVLMSLWLTCLLGLCLRIYLADRMYPMTAGDPLYSYTYRAVLISEGYWEGVKLMWHPPGYPLLLGGVTAATGGSVHPYIVGVSISLASFVGLFWIVDSLVARRSSWQGARIVAGTFVAFYETLAIWATSPLTEPVYLLMLYGTVLILDRAKVCTRRVFLAGLILGAAFCTRMEAAAPTVGLVMLILARAWSEGRWHSAGVAGVVFSLGWALSAGWFVSDVEYLRKIVEAQRHSYTFPPGGGVGRVFQCVYHATTVWLPFALLLPYWPLIGMGLLHETSNRDGPNLHVVMTAIIVPSFIAVAWTIMHKRTASFFLPAAAIWVALGIETIMARFEHRRFVPVVLMAATILLNIFQAGRLIAYLNKESPPRQAPDAVAAFSLLAAGCPPGPVWAFGSEPDIYAICRWPLVYPFFERDLDYNSAYTSMVGNPDRFVLELRHRGFRYLVFALSDGVDANQLEAQPFTGFGPPVRRDDLIKLVSEPGKFNLRLVQKAPAENGKVQSFVFAIAP